MFCHLYICLGKDNYPPTIAVRDIVIVAVRPSHFLVYTITCVNMDGFE
jgi:hypothetical protein